MAEGETDVAQTAEEDVNDGIGRADTAFDPNWSKVMLATKNPKAAMRKSPESCYTIDQTYRKRDKAHQGEGEREQPEGLRICPESTCCCLV